MGSPVFFWGGASFENQPTRKCNQNKQHKLENGPRLPLRLTKQICPSRDASVLVGSRRFCAAEGTSASRSWTRRPPGCCWASGAGPSKSTSPARKPDARNGAWLRVASFLVNFWDSDPAQEMGGGPVREKATKTVFCKVGPVQKWSFFFFFYGSLPLGPRGKLCMGVGSGISLGTLIRSVRAKSICLVPHVRVPYSGECGESPKWTTFLPVSAGNLPISQVPDSATRLTQVRLRAPTLYDLRQGQVQ